VAEQLRLRLPELDVCESSASGFDLLDATLGCSRLIVVDIMQSGNAAPGTISVFREQDVQTVPGGSPHYVGLFEALRLGKALNLDVPATVTILAVEPADCRTLGGEMHPRVRAAVAEVLLLIEAQACVRKAVFPTQARNPQSCTS
jgi:hydrogenase maturation protease